jgi:MoaA/NifB/PqqE/SkfB family radical SAM enzyme
MNAAMQKYVSPYSCYINLTSRCNLRCRHCFGSYSVPHRNELSLQEWKRVIDELVKSKVFYVNISGGEATQSPFFREFIEYLAKVGMHFILTTNGVFSRSTRDFIVRNREYLIGVKISLDGPDAESHGYLRLDSAGRYNKKVFDTTLANILFFSKKKIPLTIATVLHKKNVGKMAEFHRLIKRISPVSWFISPIIPTGRGDENRFVSESYDYFAGSFWNDICEEARSERINVRMIDMPVGVQGKSGLSAYTCPAALNFCEIHSDGTVSPCSLCRVCIPEKDMKFENIREKTILKIWNGRVFEKFRMFMDKGCEGCVMLPKCGKCIAQSYRYFRNGTSPTPFCVRNGEKLGLKNMGRYVSVLEKEFGGKEGEGR